MAVLGLMFSSTAQNIPSYIPTDSLVGYWGFDGDANDYSGNGNNGTVNGATLTEDRFGNINSAYEFDGVDDYIEVNPGINMTDYSFSFWFKTLNESGSIFSKHIESSYSSSYANYIHSGNIRNYVTIGSSAYSVGSQNQVNDNNWHHYVGTYDENKLEIYLDGVLVAEENVVGTVKNTSLSTIIGAWRNTSGNGYANFFEGSIDDIAIYDRAITSDEINNIYISNSCVDTTYITVYDTIQVFDSTYVTVYDTVIVEQSISVTDTLIMNVDITSVSNMTSNTIKFYPNPTSDILFIDNGDFSLMDSYYIRIVNTLGQEVFNETINTQQFQIEVASLGAEGTYYIQLWDENNQMIETKILILN